MHLIKHAAWRTVERGGQFVLLGSAPDARVQAEFNKMRDDLCRQYPERYVCRGAQRQYLEWWCHAGSTTSSACVLSRGHGHVGMGVWASDKGLCGCVGALCACVRMFVCVPVHVCVPVRVPVRVAMCLAVLQPPFPFPSSPSFASAALTLKC